MMGGCDTPSAKFHANLALYSVTQEKYCQLYDAGHSNVDSILDNVAPQDGTLLEGSQHVFESTVKYR